MTLINPSDTIVAPATAPGRGGIGVVRLSGPGVPVIASALLRQGRHVLRRGTPVTSRHGAGEGLARSHHLRRDRNKEWRSLCAP